MKALRVAAFVSVLTVVFTVCALAQSVEIEGVAITSADIAQLRSSLAIALKPNDLTIPVVIEWKRPNEMPPYEKQWHYDGVQDVDSWGNDQ